MKLEVLLSCMHQTDDALIHRSKLTGDVLVVNQCDREDYAEYHTEHGVVKMISTTQRGLTKSRNMAIHKSTADVCLLCDDDEIFAESYAEQILRAYQTLPQADVIIFKMIDRPAGFKNQVRRLRFPMTGRVCSWQISFRREKLLAAGVWFDELLGAGTGNGAEEELKFLLDCEKAGLQIYYVPEEIASVAQEQSTWNDGFTEQFFENRGATTRYIMGPVLAILYALNYVVRKKPEYKKTITPTEALLATFRGIRENKIGKQAARKEDTK